MALSIPACLLAALAPTDRRAVRSPASLGGLAAGMAFPTTLALITALWSGPARTRVDRAVVGDRRRDLGARAACSRARCSSTSDWGSVFLVTLPLAVVALVHGLAARAGPRQRDDRPGRQPRRHPLDRCSSARWSSPSTSRRCPNKGTLAIGLGVDRARGGGRLRPPPAARRGTRSTTSTSPRAGSSGSRRAPASSSSAR